MHTIEIFLPKQMFDFVSIFHASRITYYSNIRDIYEWEELLPILFIHRIFVGIFEGGRAQEKGEDEKSERRGIDGERSWDDRRSVLKSLLNLSLPSETAYIYRQYRNGEGLAAGRLRNRMVDTNLRLLLV